MHAGGWKDNAPEGYGARFDKNGNLIDVSMYKNGVRDGKSVFFDEKGKAIPVGADGYPEDYSFPGSWTLYDHEGNPVLHKTEGEIPTID